MSKQESLSVNSYLSFKLDKEMFALHVNKVLNILEMTKITKVPKSPYYMKGVINLRGMVLPVIDTRIKFGMTEIVNTEKTCIIVMELQFDNEKVYVGGLVDEVAEVIELEKQKIEAPPSIGNKYRAEFISGMAMHDDSFIMILNIENAFSDEELIELKEQTKKHELAQ
jgi:purine-binding chemotaxis protein CheW